MYELTVRRRGGFLGDVLVERFDAGVDPDDPKTLRAHLLDAIARENRQDANVADYSLEVRERGRSKVLVNFKTTAHG